MSERVARLVELAVTIVVLGVTGVGAYYKIDTRVALLEQRVTANELTTKEGASELNKRLDRMECKLDRVIEHQGQRPCN